MVRHDRLRWEVLYGVAPGDGVGGDFSSLFLFAFWFFSFFVFLRFSSFFRFFGRADISAICRKNGELHCNPVYNRPRPKLPEWAPWSVIASQAVCWSGPKPQNRPNWLWDGAKGALTSWRDSDCLPRASGSSAMEHQFCAVVVLILFRILLQNFQPQRQWCIKNPPPMGPKILYTTGAGKGVEVSVAILPSSGGWHFERTENERTVLRMTWELAGPLQTTDFQSSWKWQKIGQKVPNSYFVFQIWSLCRQFLAHFGVWGCDSVGLVQGTKTLNPRNMKKYEKITKAPTPSRPPNERKNAKMVIFGPFLHLFVSRDCRSPYDEGLRVSKHPPFFDVLVRPLCRNLSGIFVL